MKAESFTTEWLANQKPARRTEIADRGEGSRRVDDRSGLVVRIGPGGATKVFFRWEDARDPATGKVRRRRVRIGAWPAVSLADARKAVLEARTLDRAESSPSADLTVKQIAEAYRRDALSHRKDRSAAWSWGIIETHIVPAKPDARRGPFGGWSARSVRAPDIGAVVRAAVVRRTIELTAEGNPRKTIKRAVGGPAVARAVLGEIKAIFAHACATGTLEATPAAVLQARAFGLRKSDRARFLNAEEIKALFAALDLTALLEGTAKPRKLSPTVRLGIAFQLYVPTRTHSIIAARWDEIDKKAKRWTVPVDRLKLRKQDAAEARPFVVPLPGTGLAILERLRTEAGKSPWVLASPKDPKKHIGEKVLVRALSRLQDGKRLALGEKLTVHDLRRTWRSLAMDLGIDHAVARLSLGHAGLEGVEGVYGRSQMVEQRAQAAELVAAALDRIRLGEAEHVVPLRERKA
jgi:integrase